MSKLEKIILLSAGVILTIAILIGSTYSYIRFEGSQMNANQIVSKCFDLSFEENANSNITLKETYPMSEIDGSKLTPYTFTINNHCNNEANYQINLESLISSDLSEEYIRVKVNERESSILGSLRVTDKILEESKKSFVIEEGIINANETKTVEVRLWLDEGVNEYTDEAMNKSYFSKISVEGSYKGYRGTYTEDILNGADPIIKGELVPVTINSDGKVYKADETKEWYSYEKKNWANAVILNSTTAVDYSGNRNDGVIFGAQYSNEGLLLDGEDDYIDLKDNFRNLFKSSNTIEIKLKAFENNARDIIIGNFNSPNGINYEKTEYNKYRVWSNSGVKDVNLDKVSTVANEFVNLSFVYLKNENLVKFYINGEFISDMEMASFDYDWINAKIGRDDRTGPTAFKGVISGVRIYDRDLNSQEIKENNQVNRRENFNKNGLKLLYDFTRTQYEVNEEIPEGNIESYFVWIPRYRYQIFNDGYYAALGSEENQTKEIKIEFETKEKQASDGIRKGSWLTHPAFTSFDVNGIWVGKFETGIKGANTTSDALQNVVDTSKIQVKPNVYSWRGIQVANAHLNSYNYQRSLDSHMMKNTEWGAVAYLSHSKYGSMMHVRSNNNNNYITGYGASYELTCGNTGVNEACNKYEGTTLNQNGTYTKMYNTDAGYAASTTGNISGIYDMSGGAWEYTFGVVADKNGNPLSGRNSLNNSGFNGVFGCPTCESDTSGLISLTTGIDYPESKYYDLYANHTSVASFQKRILGDATGEMGPFFLKTYGPNTRQYGSWYNSVSFTNVEDAPWFLRGSLAFDGSEAGIFAFWNDWGQARDIDSYRIVLAF